MSDGSSLVLALPNAYATSVQCEQMPQKIAIRRQPHLTDCTSIGAAIRILAREGYDRNIRSRASHSHSIVPGGFDVTS